jgi:hypothetical protein
MNGTLEIKLTCTNHVRLFVNHKQVFTFDKEHPAVCLSLPEGTHHIRMEEEHPLLRPKWWLRTFVPFRFFGHAFFKDRFGEPYPRSSFATAEAVLKLTSDSHLALAFSLHTHDENTGSENHFLKCEKAHGVSPSSFSDALLPSVFIYRWLFEKILPMIVMILAFSSVTFFGVAPIWLPSLYALISAIRIYFLLKRLELP